MLILPTEKRFDWKHAPVMLFSIVILNVLVYFFYQSDDDRKFQQAINLYDQTGLLAYEWAAYQRYLEQEDEVEWLEEFRVQYNEGYTESIIASVIMDEDFYQFLDEQPNQITLDAYDLSSTWQNWNQARLAVNKEYREISALQGGLIPAESSALTFITHQFLHGGIMHLVGNMFFLIFCGFAVEAALGAWLFLGLYLLSGIAGGLLFVLTDAGSTAPLVGASGAISGVMAMYLGVFRLRKIEFFYWIFFFAGYFRAPALMILPFYVGVELFQYFSETDSNIAFMAHVGGFLAGGLLLAAIYGIRPDLINQEYVEEDQDTDPEREARGRIFQFIEKYQFDKAAEAIAAFTREFGKDFELMALRYEITRTRQRPEAADAMRNLVSLKPQGKEQVDRLAAICADSDIVVNQLTEEQAIKLAMNLSVPEHVAIAEDIFNHYYDRQSGSSSLAVLARKLSITFEKLKKTDKQQMYEAIAEHSIGGAH